MNPERGSVALITGCAGFLGSHLCEALLSRGHEVVGLDCFSDYYPRELKQANLLTPLSSPRFRLIEADLAADRLENLVDGVELVFHLAGQPGVRPSFGEDFAAYLHHNVHGTQRLLEAVAERDLRAFVYASSSSVYGDQDVYPVHEDAPMRPKSPYGATKVITEQLANAFWYSRAVPAVGLRYFTVYGPRQRPDMAFSRFLALALRDRPLTIHGDGWQVREFTYFADVVQATIAAAEHGERGSVYNVGGGQAVALLEAIALIESLLDRELAVGHADPANGDPRRTEADVTRAARDLSYRPATPLADGLAAQVDAVRGLVRTRDLVA
jgi:nucleoside-diphosphate-sugar epimerase